MESADLSVVIPAHDAAATITDVIKAFLSIEELAVQVIVVDDVSSDSTAEDVARLAAADSRVLLLRHETNRGAGVARNTAFPHATGRYTLFFDADDIVHPGGVVRAVQDLDAGGQDVAVLRYRYRRGLYDTQVAMNHYDLKLWTKYLGHSPARTVRLTEASDLLGLTNYPWNKVLRTSTYRRAGLRFGSTPVHNDILGHWYSLLFADQILLIDQEICTHIVLETGHNLTNRATGDRLSLFDALDETYTLLESHPDLRQRYSHIYWDSTLRLVGWASTRIDPAYKDDFASRLREHCFRIDLGDLLQMRMRRAPDLARQLVRKALC